MLEDKDGHQGHGRGDSQAVMPERGPCRLQGLRLGVDCGWVNYTKTNTEKWKGLQEPGLFHYRLHH